MKRVLNFRFNPFETGKVLSPEEVAAINSGRLALYCVGYIRYHDADDEMRLTGFSRKLAYPYRRFRRFEDPEYDYED